MSHIHVLSFNEAVEPDSGIVTERIDAIVDREFPPVRGWSRTVSKGGMLSAGSVSFSRETANFSGTIVVFLDVVQTSEQTLRLSYDVTAVLAEKLADDDRFYSFDGSFLNGLGTVMNARVALKKLADERRAMARDFV